MAGFKDLIVKIGADTSGLAKGVDAATAKLGGLRAAGEGLVTIGAGLSAGLTAPIVAMGAAALTAGGQMEQARVSFTTMLGSAEKSAAFLKDLENFAKSTPFQFDGLVTASKQMLAFGFASEDIIPNLTAVGDAIAAVGGGEEAIQGVIRALGQMSAKGKVSAEEINQLSERGIGAWKYLASEAGVSIAEIQKLAEKGALDAGVAIKTIVEGMGREFGGIMSEQSEKLLGRIANLQDTFGQSLTRLGEALIPFANQAVDLAVQMADAFSGAVDVFTGMGPGMQTAVVAVAGLAAAIGPLAAGVGGLMLAWGTLGPSIMAAGSVISAVATGPVGIAVLAIAGLSAAAYTLADQLGVLDPIIAAFGTAFDYIAGAVVAVVDNFHPLIVGIGAFAAELFAANPLVAALYTWVGEKLVWAFGQIGSIIKTVVLIHLDALGKVFGFVADKAKALFDYFVGKGKTALGDTGTAFETTAAASNELLDELDAIEGRAKTTSPAIKNVGGAALVLATNAKTAKTDVFDLDKALKGLETTNKEVERIAKAAATALAQDMGGAAVDLKADVDAVNAATVAAMNSIAGWTQTAATAWDATAAKASATANSVDAAFKAMGLSTKSQLEQAATDAETNFDLIAGSGQASAAAIDAAWIQMLEARKAALIANGQDLGTEEQKILDDLKRRQGQHAADTKTIWSTWADGIKGVVNNLDIGGKIFAGHFAPGRWKETLKGIAGDFVNVFIQPLKDAINDFIATGLKKLTDALFGVGEQVDGLFGGGGGGGGTGPSGGGDSGGGGWASGLGGSAGGDPVQWALEATGIILDLARGKRHGEKLTLIEENTRFQVLLFDQFMQQVGFFQNDEMQKQTGNLEYIVANGDDMKSSLWSIRDLLSGGIAISGLTGSGHSDVTSAVEDGATQAGGALTAPMGSRTGAPDGTAGPTGQFSGPNNSRTAQIGVGGNVGTFSAPLGSRTGQRADAQIIADTIRETLEARNPLAVLAAQLGNPLAQLATGSNFLPDAVAAQTEAIEAQTQADAAQTSAITTTGNDTVYHLQGIQSRLDQFIATVHELLSREIVINIDNQEIARAVGAGTESLRATA